MLKRSCKGSPCLAFLEQQIDEIAVSKLSRSEKTNQAVLKVLNLSEEEILQKSIQLRKYKSKIPDGLNYPTALQVMLDQELAKVLDEAENKLKRALDLHALQSRYELELLWFIYLGEIKKDVMHVGDKITIKEKEDLTGPEMVKCLVEMLMLNREEDKDIINRVKGVLLEWKL